MSRNVLKKHNENLKVGRLIGFDYGSKRLGIAVSDPLQLIATPLTTIHPKEASDWLAGYLEKEVVSACIIGMPSQSNNEPSEIVPKVNEFAKMLGRKFSHIPQYFVEERRTSKQAVHSMVISGTKRSERRKKGNIDMISATLILQTFMEDNH